MGCSRWDSSDWASYSSTHTKGKSAKEIYKSTDINSDLDPKDISIRESRDSDLNPKSNAIIIAQDVTGSMYPVLESMIQKSINVLLTELYDRSPVSDPHVMLMGIGDVRVGDDAPLQVTQFEADIKIAEQLQKIYLEGGGGGNNFESYHLPWYFAATHTSIDCFEKRGKKGYLFTIGDECAPDDLRPDEIEKIIGDKVQSTLSAEELLDMVSRTYDVYHIVIKQGNYARHNFNKVMDTWHELLGQRVIPLEDHKYIGETITSIIQLNEGEAKETVLSSWDGKTKDVVSVATDALNVTQTSDNEESDVVVLK